MDVFGFALGEACGAEGGEVEGEDLGGGGEGGVCGWEEGGEFLADRGCGLAGDLLSYNPLTQLRKRINHLFQPLGAKHLAPMLFHQHPQPLVRPDQMRLCVFQQLLHICACGRERADIRGNDFPGLAAFGGGGVVGLDGGTAVCDDMGAIGGGECGVGDVWFCGAG